MSEPTWSFAQTFATDFQTTRTDLESRITAITASSTASQSRDALNELSIALAKLTKRLADATPSLPTYDQRQYNQQIKELELSLTELRTKAVPKSKFAFKRKAGAVPSSASSTPITTSKESPPPATAQPSTETTNVTLSSQSNKVLNWESIPEFTGGNDLTIVNLDYCLVDLISRRKDEDQNLIGRKTISAVHIDTLRDTVLILPMVEGSVLIHNLLRCTIVVGCHQFRMHNSHNVHIYLSIPSNPVIEHCNEIRFSHYPEDLALPEEHKLSKHHEVLDFSHILPTPSPHWSVLPDEKKVTTWKDNADSEDLNTYLPLRST